MNEVNLIGRLGADPLLKTTQTGKQVATVSLATSEYYKDQNGQKIEKTEWHRLVCWEKTAELIAKFCKKGHLLYVKGVIKTREYIDEKQNKRYTTEIFVKNMEFLESKKETSENLSYGKEAYAKALDKKEAKSLNEEPEFIIEDIPF